MLRNIILIIGVLFSVNSFAINTLPAQKEKTIIQDTLHVEGNCDMCKARIEDAALIKGVKKATWYKNAHSLVVIYDSSKTDTDKIQQAIAEVGHDTERHKANSETYSKLPKCCAYREEGAKIH